MDKATRAQRAKSIIEQFGGVFPVYEAFHIHALIYAAGRAVDAFARFDRAVQVGAADDAEIVAIAHEALTHVGALSRFFWPSRQDALYLARGQKLWQTFLLSENSPLFDRNLRNALEHFDERIDEFLLDDRAGQVFPGPVVGPVALAREVPNMMFRLVDPETDTFVLLGEEHSFAPLREVAAAILRRAQELNANGGRLRRPSSAAE